MAKPTVCIVCLSHLARDARVLRQIKALQADYALTAVGFGEKPAFVDPHIAWVTLPTPSPSTATRACSALQLLAGRVSASFFAQWFNRAGTQYAALRAALQNISASCYIANDWNTLPAVCAAAQRHGGKVIFDAHEYSPLEYDHLSFRVFHAPLIRYVLRNYVQNINASMTVCEPIARRYKEEYGLAPVVVYNVPDFKVESLESKIEPPAAGFSLQLVHHGAAAEDRELELMIDAMAQAPANAALHFILVGNPAYVAQLRGQAARVAAEKVHFHDAVSANEVVSAISRYNLGFYLLRPRGFNNASAMPNKFFEFLLAGLPVLIGPSPAMAELVQKHECGWVAPGFDAASVAAVMKSITLETYSQKRAAALRMAEQFNFANESQKIRELVRKTTAVPGS